MTLCSVRSSLSIALSMVMFVGSPVLAAEAVAVRSTDYLLGQKGVLVGSVVNQQGQPAAGLPVQVLHDGRVVATAYSDEQGEFAVESLRNGIHTVQLGETQRPVRFWSNAAAPPSAVSRMAIVVDEEVVRGQCGEFCGEGCGEGGCRAGGLTWGTTCGLLLVGGAVATTLALTLDDQKSGAAVASP